MNARHIVLGVALLCVTFAAVAGYLYYSDQATAGAGPLAAAEVAGERGVTVSGRPGALVIAYAGDIHGDLGPCG